MGARLAHARGLGWAGRRRESRGAAARIGDVTVVPVARQRAIALRLGALGVVLARTRPARVEVRGPDGVSRDVGVTDVHSRVRLGAAMLAALLVIVTILGRLR